MGGSPVDGGRTGGGRTGGERSVGAETGGSSSGLPDGLRQGGYGREMSCLLSSSMLTSLNVTTRTERTKRLER